MLLQSSSEIEPCLVEGPVCGAARILVEAAHQLGDTPAASVLRAWCVAFSFRRIEMIFSSGEEPVSALNRLFETTARLLRALSECRFAELVPAGTIPPAKSPRLETVETVTGNHYGHLFQCFSSTSFWDEAADLLRTRLERNGVDLASIKGKYLIDVGCGCGRYTAAWRRLGACPALGVDISPINIGEATRRVGHSGLGDIRFQLSDVLHLPFKDDRFDIVFSNGVLHHTRDWKAGIAELVRVLKPGGLGWLYMIERPGGLFWDVVEVLRVIMRDEERDLARTTLHALGLPGNRVFYILDHVMAPINARLTPNEIEECLKTAGARELRRLTRGAHFDRIESLYRGDAFASVKYGVGENRYIFSKR